MKPDFFIIPEIVHASPALNPADWIVYAVVYWFEHMRDGKCTASNPAIARVAGVGDRAVRGALDRLERAGFIKRVYQDKRRKDRLQIISKVRFGIQEQEKEVEQATSPLPGMEVANAEEKIETPGEYARKFFSGDSKIIGEIGQQLEDAGVPKIFIVSEMLKFKNYWTEPTLSGKKQRWQTQPTFEVRRRLGTWLRNAADRSNQHRKSGAGVTIS